MNSNNRSLFALLALALSAFAIGTTEFVIVGLLPTVATDLGVSVTAAGLTVSIYALGVAFGAPILTALTSRISRKKLLILIMVVFIIGNGIGAVAPTFTILLISRVIASFAHGVFMSIGSTIAADIVTPEKRSSAIAIMFTGLTVATITGVPFGTFIGQTFGWRATFLTIAIIGLISLIGNMILVPNNLKEAPITTVKDSFRVLTNKRLVLVFAITALGYGGTFVTYTYLAPMLEDITGFASSAVTYILLGYGIMVAIGNLIGGKLTNQNPANALYKMFFAQAIVLVVLSFTAPSKTIGLATIMLLGLFAFMNVPGLQLYVVQLAEKHMPQAVGVASAMNIAAFNVGIASGSSLGGIVTEKLGLIHTPWVGAIMVAGAVILTIWSNNLDKKEQISYKQAA